jgi:hypothetical protein
VGSTSGVRGGAVDAGLAVLVGGVVGGGFGVGGRKEELISPIPMKKSSDDQLHLDAEGGIAYMVPL